MKTVVNTALDPTLRSSDAQNFELALRRKIVGQDSAIEKVAEIYQMFLAGLNAPSRPVGNFLFLGPTGSSFRCCSSTKSRRPATRFGNCSSGYSTKLRSRSATTVVSIFRNA